MKIAIAFAAMLAVASAQFNYNGKYSTRPPLFAPGPSSIPSINRGSTNDAVANIIKYESDSTPDGSFAYSFETENGISAEAQGTPRDFGGNPPVVPVVISGRSSFYDPDGKLNTITYIADENGYQPQGDSIPTPPPIPDYILRALEFIAKNAPYQPKK